MALRLYDQKLNVSGDLFWNRPKQFILPPESEKYILTRWNSNYSLYNLSNMVYGNASFYWLILAANNKANPYSFTAGEEVRVLLPKFLNEVITK